MIAFSSNWMILFPVAFSLFVAMRLSQGSVDEGRKSWFVLALRSAIVMMFWFSILAVGLRAHWLSLVWLVLVAGFAFIIYWKRRRLERNVMFSTAVTVKGLDQQQALVGFFYDENTGWMRRKAAGLRRDLALGVPWERSLELRGVAVGVYERLGLRLHAMYGTYGQVDSGDNSLRSPLQIEAEAERLLGRFLVFGWTVFIAPLIMLIMVFIVPTFQEMFDEFGMNLPSVMLADIWVADMLANTGLGAMLSLVPIAIFICVLLALMVWLFPVMLQLPVFRWLCADYYRNVGFTALSHVVDKEPELIRACQTTAQLVPLAYLSQNYLVAAEMLSRGLRVGDAFEKARLVSAGELKAFGHSLDTSDPSWALQQLANWKIDRMLRRYSIFVQVMIVILTLILSLVVASVAIGIIAALYYMVLSLS